MARAIWSGTLSFGLVSIPVELYSATVDRTIHFNQFEAGTSDRIRNKRVNERTGEEVDYADIVKGYDLGGGDYVLLSPEELEAVEPGRSRTIEVLDFVDSDQIDPIYYRKAYYLVPKGEAAARAYALLRQAMLESQRVGVAMFVMRAKQYLVAIRPEEELLALETMFFADEIVDPSQEIAGLPVPAAEFKPRELEAAKLLIDSMAAEWNPHAYRDTYREAVQAMVERKRQGEEIVTESTADEPAPVVDLLEALSASVAAARARQKSGGGAVSGGRRPERAASAPKAGAAGNGTAGKGTAGKGTAGKGTAGKGTAGKGTAGKGTAGKGTAGKGTAGKGTGRPIAARQPAAGTSKSELYEQAASLGIAGRSRMSRQELERAVRAATSRERKAS
jgi:DNA end-binding protein Ku